MECFLVILIVSQNLEAQLVVKLKLKEDKVPSDAYRYKSPLKVLFVCYLDRFEPLFIHPPPRFTSKHPYMDCLDFPIGVIICESYG